VIVITAVGNDGDCGNESGGGGGGGYGYGSSGWLVY